MTPAENHDFLVRLLEVYNEHNNYGNVNGMEFNLVDYGHVEHFMTIKEEHLATPKFAHGGAIAGFIDAVIGVAALSKTGLRKKRVATVEFKLNYLEPVLLGDQLKGIGKVESEGNRIVVVNGEIYNQDNKLVAKAIGTLYAWSIEKSDLADKMT